MGFYVNPRNEKKEQFLAREGDPIPLDFPWESVMDYELPVVLVDNGMFTAAAIAFRKDEWELFTSPDDSRPRRAYLVEVEKLLPVSDLKLQYIER